MRDWKTCYLWYANIFPKLFKIFKLQFQCKELEAIPLPRSSKARLTILRTVLQEVKALELVMLTEERKTFILSKWEYVGRTGIKRVANTWEHLSRGLDISYLSYFLLTSLIVSQSSHILSALAREQCFKDMASLYGRQYPIFINRKVWKTVAPN